ncbi:MULTISPECIES: GGDEF domain-containing protein [Methylococcus]|uniref:diguanylate cyclase n=1 Tax=Methylococcus capsulatus TaxID=414 RepID=A0ABZ2F337_METCP|nr:MULTISPECIES: diguanylate cyclase [Methylococcus]
MIRLTRKVFVDLSIWMIGFGLLIGLVFPFFTLCLGIPSSYVLTPVFFTACIAAGFAVGAMNIALARSVVGERARLLAERMGLVASRLQDMAQGNTPEKCTPEHCAIEVDSDDEIGDGARAFNQLIQSLALSIETETAVRTFTEMLVSELDVHQLTEQALALLLQHTGADGGAILVEVEGGIRVAASHGIGSPHTLANNDRVRHALRTERRHRVKLPEDLLVDGMLAQFRPREVLIDPVQHKEVVLGAVVLASGQGFSVEDRNRLDVFERGLALALHNAILYDRLQTLAALDPLTGTYNRRFGVARLREEFQRAVRLNLPLGLLMFDIDYFKRINDTYGHLAGDRVLARVAKTARSVLREGDVLIRYGGEEFIAVLPAASRPDLEYVGERLRHMVDDLVVVDGDQSIRVTVSIGATAYPDTEVEDETALVDRADKALYAAKTGGRNRLVIS